MKKNKFYVVFVVCFCTMLILALVSCGNNTAEEVVALENQKTNIASWFESNIGWFVGIPIGTVAGSILEIIALSKKSKEYTKDLFANSETRKEVKTAIKEISETNVKFGKFVTKTENGLLELDKKVDDSISKMETTAESFKEVANKVDNLKSEIEALLQTLSLMASQDKDLVASGVSEKVNKIVESIKTE